MCMTSAVSAWRWRHVLRSLDRQWRRRLEADLAGATPRDRTDLTALLDRYDDDDTAVLPEILGASRTRRSGADDRRRGSRHRCPDPSSWSTEGL